jgi:hypothetical protein
MTAATSALDVQSSVIVASPLVYRLAGLAFATVLPAFFWVTFASTVGPAFGVTLTPLELIIAGSAIALFLGSVCAPIVLKTHT